MQVTLIPSIAPTYDETGVMTNGDVYAAAEWRWTDGATSSAWFATRDDAYADAVVKNPDAAIG